MLIDLDWYANDCAMQIGAQPQYTLLEVADNLSRMDQALFEGFVTRDPLGFFLVGPPDSLEHRGYFSENMFREFAGGATWRAKTAGVEPPRTVRNAERKALHELGLEEGAERPEIKARFKELVKRHHPDANGGDRGSEDKLREIIQAYNYLKSVGAC